MNVVDSSGWIEFALDGPNAGIFEPPLQDADLRGLDGVKYVDAHGSR